MRLVREVGLRLRSSASTRRPASTASSRGGRRTTTLDVALDDARACVDDIASGRFADEWDAERDAGYPQLEELRERTPARPSREFEEALRRQLGRGRRPVRRRTPRLAQSTTIVDKLVGREDRRRAHRAVPGPRACGSRRSARRSSGCSRATTSTRRSRRSTRPPAPRCRRSRCKTVYQTVHDLEAWVRSTLLDLGTGSVRVDPNVEHRHHHLICTECGAVRDVRRSTSPTCGARAAPAAGFSVDAVEVNFRGVCDDCAATAVEPSCNSATDTPQGAPRMPDLNGTQDPRQPQGGVRRREPGQPPLPLLRPEGRRRGLPRRRRAVPLGRRGRDRPRVRPLRLPRRGRRPGHRRRRSARPPTT